MVPINKIGSKSRYYPQNLNEIKDRPKRFWARGNIKLLREEKLMTVVGSREMTSYGEKVVERLVPELVQAGWVIVSGMALGVDAKVHQICLDNRGKTIAILAGGVEMPSPWSNRWLYQRILDEGGLIISEYPPGITPDSQKFLARDRIMAGISQGVLVIEGSERSGTRVTARLAMEYGRDVGAVPGAINAQNSWLPNWLIRNGAKLVERGEDIVTSL